jgi:aminoglycoside phosphotransferase (APT) family kinase protein
VFVPRLLHHDPSYHILIIEDLGELPSVDKWLEKSHNVPESTLSSISSDLGSFLADIHSCTTPENHAWLQEQFKNADAKKVVFAAAVEPILAILQDYDIPDAQSIYEFVVDEFGREDEDLASLVFSMGDLWTGSILVADHGDRVGIIDWEFATLAPPSQDIGQLGWSISYETDNSCAFLPAGDD